MLLPLELTLQPVVPALDGLWGFGVGNFVFEPDRTLTGFDLLLCPSPVLGLKVCLATASRVGIKKV